MAKKTNGSQHVLQYRRQSIEKQLENHIKTIESEIQALQNKLETAKKHHSNYLENKDTIETILSFQEETAPKRKYKRKQEE